MTGPRAVVWFFVGPSVARARFDEACSSLAAEVHVLAPVQQGDLLLRRGRQPHVVGIIDGSFFQVPSVTHKEILAMVERGVRVVGAASLGALRAAELDRFGMTGVGHVYQLYKRGVIDGDDEVAVSQNDDPDEPRPLSDALVDIRFNLGRACRQGLISSSGASAVVSHAKRLHFSARSYDAALSGAEHGLDHAALRALQHFLRHDRVDVKEQDSLALVDWVRAHLDGERSTPGVPPVRVSRTVYLHLLDQAYRGGPGDGQLQVADQWVLSLCKLWDPSFERLVGRVRRRCLAVDEGLEREVPVPEPAEIVHHFRRARRLLAPDGYQAWLDRRGLDVTELEGWLRDRALEDAVVRLYRRASPDASTAQLRRLIEADVRSRVGSIGPPGSGLLFMLPGIPWEPPLVREAKAVGVFRRHLPLLGRMVGFAAGLSVTVPGFTAALSPERLTTWAAERWAIDGAGIGAGLARRGFTSYSEFLEIARLAYTYEKMGPQG